MASPRQTDLPDFQINLETGGSTPKIQMSPYTSVSYQIVFDADGGNSAGTVYVESSNNGVNWSMYPDTSLSWDNSTDNHLITANVYKTKFIRFTVANASGTGGTGTVISYLTTNLE